MKKLMNKKNINLFVLFIFIIFNILFIINCGNCKELSTYLNQQHKCCEGQKHSHNASSKKCICEIKNVTNHRLIDEKFIISQNDINSIMFLLAKNYLFQFNPKIENIFFNNQILLNQQSSPPIYIENCSFVI